jgi:hypothetical protein
MYSHITTAKIGPFFSVSVSVEKHIGGATRSLRRHQEYTLQSVRGSPYQFVSTRYWVVKRLDAITIGCQWYVQFWWCVHYLVVIIV